MKNLTCLTKLFLPVLALTIISNIVCAQKLPNVQTASLRSPANIKIDGQASEFKNQFQAYNSATDIFYTLSNDDNNLYLTVQVKYHDVIDKILRGGITFTINHNLSKKDKDHVSITYPFTRGIDQADLSNMFLRKEIQKKDANDGNIAVDDINKLLDTKSKTIKVNGINGITDEDISVYNQEGIKAVSQFNKQLIYTYELAIPIKYLTLPNTGVSEFSYNIKINGPDESVAIHATDGPPPPPMAMTSTVATDFWGQYTLAK